MCECVFDTDCVHYLFIYFCYNDICENVYV